jgi:MFS family permease
MRWSSSSADIATTRAGAWQAWTLIFAMFLPIMAIIALAPALPTLMDRFHDTPRATTLVPMLLTVPALSIAVFGGIAGYMTDRFGRRNLMLLAMTLYLISGAGPFFLHTFQSVLVSRIFLGIAEAFVLAIGNALLADYFNRDEQHKWLMVQGIVGPFLATGLLAVSGILASHGWQWPFLLYGLTLPILLLGMFCLHEPPRRQREAHHSQQSTFPAATVTLICLMTFIVSVLYFIEPIHYSLVLREIGVNDEVMIGRISAIASIAVPFGAYLFRRNARWRIQTQLALVLVLMGIGLIGIGTIHNYKLSMAAALFQQTAAGMTIPTLIAWALHALPVEHRGRGMGLWAAALFFGQFSSPLFVSPVRSATGGLMPAVSAFGVVCLLLAVGSFATLSLKRPTQAVRRSI